MKNFRMIFRMKVKSFHMKKSNKEASPFQITTHKTN